MIKTTKNLFTKLLVEPFEIISTISRIFPKSENILGDSARIALTTIRELCDGELPAKMWVLNIEQVLIYNPNCNVLHW